jgi:hypothetical protein
MFEQTLAACPHCGSAIRQELREGEPFACGNCAGRFDVLHDPRTRKVLLVPERDEVVEPLWLPRGTLRAVTAILLALSCWVLLLSGRGVPPYLLSLVLAVAGFYFASRPGRRPMAYDPTRHEVAPTARPRRLIQIVLVAGFAITGLAVLGRGEAFGLDLASFYLILGGLVAGHVFARLLGRIKGHGLYWLAHHGKGVLLLAAAGVLTYAFLSGAYRGMPAAAMIVVCSFVSFYYGSRT